jgi:multimeric flavodoxin WrbA
VSVYPRWLLLPLVIPGAWFTGLVALGVLILLGSPQGTKGESGQFAEEIIEELHRADTHTTVVNVSELSFAACGGCLACEKEDDCIAHDDVQKFQEQVLSSEGLILTTPVYLMGPPGRLKCLLDRLWVWALRPRLFDKYAGVVVVSGSYGALDVAAYMTGVLESFGMQVIDSVAGSLMTPSRAEVRKRMLIDARLLSRRIAEAISSHKHFPISSTGKTMATRTWNLIRDNKETFAKSYDYWRENAIANKFGIPS